MKYIILKTKICGIEKKVPIIFPNEFVHAFVAKAAQKLIIQHWNVGSEVVSAGDADILNVVCSGESTTLKVASEGDADSQVIEMYNYTHGIDI